MGEPIVSIGFPVYNGGDYTEKAIFPMLDQTFKNFELIISDNASTDNTSDVCQRYAKMDSRIRYYRNESNMGCAWNFRNVFHHAKGKYFIWACHDDVWKPQLLEKYTEVLDTLPDVVCCYSRTIYIDENDKEIRGVIGRPDLTFDSAYRRFHLFLKYHTPTNECSQVLGLFRTEVLKKTPLINRYPSSDMILLGEIALYGKSHEIQDVLLMRRDHPEKSTTLYPTMEERAAWNDPTQKGKIQLTTWRWLFEWHRSILRSTAGIVDKWKSIIDVWKWAFINKGNMKKELKKCVKRLIHQNA